MPSLLDLTNRSLSELGRLPVVAIDNSPDAVYVSNKIIELYPEVLLEANWNFAVKFILDSSPLTTPFSPDYSYAYLLPGDFGKFFKWAAVSAQWPIYEFADGLLLAQTLPVEYYYITNQAPFEVFTPLFSRAVVLYAAAKCAPTLTNNVALASYLEKEYMKALTKAILENDMQRSVSSTPYNDFNRITYV